MPACALAAPSEEDLFFRSAAEVSEGELRFLARLPDKPVHHHRNRVTIRDESLETGWVTLEQCHEHLDPMPGVQIVYAPGRTRDLRILSHSGIGRAWVEADSVQMEGIGPGASICIRAETLALARSDGGYALRNGPYMRKFLDGYYPMRVTMTVVMETPGLRFSAIEPAAQPGFRPWQRDNEAGYEAAFEGMLHTVIRFERTKSE